ncbi:MAG: helicase, partial [Thermoprotei archaeon]
MKEEKNILPIHPRLANQLEKEGYKSLNYIQLKSFKLAKRYKSLVIIAPTGSGKTEAAFFPILNELLEKGGQPVYTLYITPLRALNRDIHIRMKDFIEKLGYRVEIRHGDTPEKIRRRIAKNPPHFLITTPETLQFLLVGKKMREALKNVEWIVVDELHELMDNKRGSQLTLALERLKKLARRSPRIIALSATISKPDLALKFVSGRSFGTVLEWYEQKGYSIRIDDIDDNVSANDTPLPPEFYSRMKRLAEYASKGGVLIFTNTRDTAELVGRVLRTYFGLNVRVHHGSLSKEERIEVERMFKRGEIKAVVATSSLELGIDIGHVNLVVQYASPRQAIRLVQRVGRASHRLGEVSRGIIIPIDLEDAIESAVLARRAERENLEDLRIHEKPLDVLAHQITGLTMEYRALDIGEVYDLVTRAYPYRELSLGEMGQLLKKMDDIRTVK